MLISPYFFEKHDSKSDDILDIGSSDDVNKTCFVGCQVAISMELIWQIEQYTKCFHVFLEKHTEYFLHFLHDVAANETSFIYVISWLNGWYAFKSGMNCN